MEQELLTLLKHMTSPPVFSGIHLGGYLAFCVVCILFSFFFWTLQSVVGFTIAKVAFKLNQTINQPSIYGF
jgi:hypothetical protein